jgi:hypothetical protein
MKTSRDADLLKCLQDWYVPHCDGGWEHTYGISIDTLDHPGWHLKVELTDTDLSDRSFDEVIFDVEDKNDWYRCFLTEISWAIADPLVSMMYSRYF